MNDPYQPSSVTDAPPPPPTATLSSDERMWAMLGHLSALSGLIFPVIGNIAGPLIVWQIKKDTMPFAAQEAKEALNFNITWIVGLALLGVVAFVLSFFIIGFLLFPVVALGGIAMIVFSIIAGLKANEGRPYRYPMTMRIVN